MKDAKKKITTHGYKLYIRKLSDAILKAKVARTLNVENKFNKFETIENNFNKYVENKFQKRMIVSEGSGN